MSYLTIYKASAGSGKTFTLAAKYTAFLLSGDEMAHAHLLAVTFTNKATGEMKERILRSLYSIAHGQNPNDGFLKLVREHLTGRVAQMSLDDLRKRAQRCLSDLIHDYDHFTVQTIDSFFQSLLANLAHELGLPANFRVQINDKEVYARAVDNIMARIGAEKLTDPSDVKLRHWVRDFIRLRIGDDKGWEINHELKNFASQLSTDAYIGHAEELSAAMNNMEALRDFEQELRKQEATLKQMVVNKAKEVHDHILQQSGCDDVAEAYVKLFKGNYPNHFVPYIRDIISGDVNREPAKSILKYCDKGTAIGGEIRALEDLRTQLAPRVNSFMLARRNINELRLLADIAREVDKINEEENHFMLGNTPVLFDRLIGDTDAPFVMERAGNRFEHIMIDEFQDTSPIQWRNFEKLLINNIAQGQESLIVGDVKQGIYRFRGGDWRKLTELSVNNPKNTHNLDTNYRSAEHVIGFNNAIFAQMPQTMQVPWPDDAKQQTNSQRGGYVRVRYNDEDLLEDVASQIRMLRDEQGLSLSQIAILIRNNHDADELIDHFRLHHNDLRLISSESFYLRSSRAVQRLMAALRYLRDVGHKAEEKDLISQTYLEQESPLPEAFVEQRVQLARRPLYELCETIIEMFQLTQCEDETPFLFYFLDQVLEYLEENPSNLHDFVAYWDEALSGKSIPGGESDAIRIITIHKSKGLAFHTVLMPFFDWRTIKYRPDNILWCDCKEAPLDYLPILPIHPQAEMGNSVFADEYNEDREAQQIENLNLVYVAFTRAEHNLLVWASCNQAKEKPSKSTSKKDSAPTVGEVLYGTLQAVCSSESIPLSCERENDCLTYTYGSPHLEAVSKQEQGSKESTNPFAYVASDETVRFTPCQRSFRFRQSSKAREFFTPLTDAEEGYRHDGTLLHDIMSRIQTTDDITAALQWAQREGLATAEWVERHRSFITSRVTSPRTRDWFSSRWQVYNEQAIICPHPTRPMLTTRRPDRVITDGERTVVIDFKFARHNANHYLQVEQYCQLLREMGHQHVEGYLWYVYNNEIVEVVSNNI
ncbi:MAG: UvrD-helicase domain-containing protein [Bacteroidaceae bacterium]|nr:UvrD-helicase domain-containing protein [Bacteroidaceae bacterium]